MDAFIEPQTYCGVCNLNSGLNIYHCLACGSCHHFIYEHYCMSCKACYDQIHDLCIMCKETCTARVTPVDPRKDICDSCSAMLKANASNYRLLVGDICCSNWRNCGDYYCGTSYRIKHKI